jgi:hypothetical protein
MAKKFGKLAFLGVIAGAAAGTYYYFQNKDKKPKEAADDFDDFDDFDDDLEDEDFSSENSGDETPKPHSYVSIDLDGAKEKIGEKVIETLDKTKEKIERFNVSEKIDKAKEFIGEKISAQDGTEPTYTQMDMTSGQSASDDDGFDFDEDEEEKISNNDTDSTISLTYSDDNGEEDISDNFFSHN